MNTSYVIVNNKNNLIKLIIYGYFTDYSTGDTLTTYERYKIPLDELYIRYDTQMLEKALNKFYKEKLVDFKLVVQTNNRYDSWTLLKHWYIFVIDGYKENESITKYRALARHDIS